jgi:hypothetical protein
MTYEHTDDLTFDDIIVDRGNIEYWQQQFEDRRDLIGSELIARLLKQYYEDDAAHFHTVSVGGETRVFPTLARQPWLRTNVDPDDVIASFSETPVAKYDKKFIWQTAMQRAALSVDPADSPVEVSVRDHVWNDPIYNIDRISADGETISFDTSMTDYYTYVSHSVKLVEELYKNCRRANITSATVPSAAATALEGQFTERDRLAPTFDAMVANNSHHLLGSIVTTLVEMPDGEHFITVMKRSDTNVDFPDTLGLAPSGAFSPWFSPEDECDFQYQILREVAEEVFGRDSLVRAPEKTDNAWVNMGVPAKALGRLLDDDNSPVDLAVTGFAFNTLSAAPQVSSLLYIRDPTYASWVYDVVTNRMGDPLREGDVRMVKASDAIESLFTDKWAPGAAVALAQSLRVAVDEYGADIDIDFDVTLGAEEAEEMEEVDDAGEGDADEDRE